MKKRKLKKLLAQALQQLAVMQLPAGQPVETPAANDAPAAEGQTVAEWLTTYRSIIGQRGYNPQTVKNRTTSIEDSWRMCPMNAQADAPQLKPNIGVSRECFRQS